MFILMRTTMDMKYMPMIWEKKRRMMLELFELEIQMKNFDIVNSRPDSSSSFYSGLSTNGRYEAVLWNPDDPYVFGSFGSEFVSMRYRSASGFGSRSFYRQTKIVRKTFLPPVL
jgi:hypothetical protein